jgi:small redox-active disulfide protein 2
VEIKILGSGCEKCKRLAEQTEQMVTQLNIKASIQKVTNINEISHYGVLILPALIIDGKVKTAGRVPPIDELKRILMEPSSCEESSGSCSCGCDCK